MSENFSHLLLIGSSVRAAAASAVRAGFEVFAIDRFGDADLQRLATVVPITNWPGDVCDAVQGLPRMPWMYCGSMENEPELVARVSRYHRLLGNDPDVLKLIRNPFWVEATLAARNLPALRLCSVIDAPSDGEWLIKPIRSGGGQGIFVWDGTRQVQAEHYLQEFRRGQSMSALFVAVKRDVELIGLTEQLVGRANGAPSDFGYAGSIGPMVVPNDTTQCIERIGRELAQTAGLRGLFGIDFILEGDRPWLTEVNPRYTASAEIYEQAWNRSLVAEHVRACESDPDFEFPIGAYSPRRLVGKRIVYAEADILAPNVEDKSAGLADFIADIPMPGSRIAAGCPVCTVFAAGDDRLAVCHLLTDRARSVVRRISDLHSAED